MLKSIIRSASPEMNIVTGDVDWWRGPFDWPLWILFSSGTTSELSFGFIFDSA